MLLEQRVMRLERKILVRGTHSTTKKAMFHVLEIPNHLKAICKEKIRSTVFRTAD